MLVWLPKLSGILKRNHLRTISEMEEQNQTLYRSKSSIIHCWFLWSLLSEVKVEKRNTLKLSFAFSTDQTCALNWGVPLSLVLPVLDLLLDTLPDLHCTLDQSMLLKEMGWLSQVRTDTELLTRNIHFHVATANDHTNCIFLIWCFWSSPQPTCILRGQKVSRSPSLKNVFTFLKKCNSTALIT